MTTNYLLDRFYIEHVLLEKLARYMLVLLVINISVWISACSISDTNQERNTGSVPPERQYLIGPSDVLSINVWNHKELNQTVTVRPDGKLSFSLVGDIQAAGLSPLKLQSEIEGALNNYMRIVPGEVSVVVDEVHSYKVSVMGEVRKPGRFEFQNQVSILDALAEAGGLTEFSSGDRILIIRTYQGKKQKIEFDYNKLIKPNSSSVPVLLFPGDIVLVP